MPRLKLKNTINNRDDNDYLLEDSNTATRNTISLKYKTRTSK